MKKPVLLASLAAFMILFISCDPGLKGDMKVFNQSDSILTVVAYNHGAPDSATFTIAPNSSEIIKTFGGLGDQKAFDCCPCEFHDIRITTANGSIRKDPNSKDNWVIPNKSKQKKFGGEDLKCEFYVTAADI